MLHVEVEDLNTQSKIEVSLLRSIPSFPPSTRLAKDYNHIFIRDFIDAITCYLNYNFDESVRKVITSLENFFHETHNSEKTFKAKLKKCIVADNYPSNWNKYLVIFVNNILIMYGIRNNIVHNKLRLNGSHTLICMKGMYTLFYIYQCALNDKQTTDFIRSLNMQFNLIQSVSKGRDLDDFAIMQDKPKISIDSMEDLDRVIFTGMEIDKKELSLITSERRI